MVWTQHADGTDWSAFRYDADLPGYVFNLSTKNLSTGTWELRFRVTGDAREYSVTFDLR